MSNFNNNNCKSEYEGDNNFYDDFSSVEVSEEEVSDEVSEEEAPIRRRKRRRATTPPRKRRRLNKSTEPSICNRFMNFLRAIVTSPFYV